MPNYNSAGLVRHNRRCHNSSLWHEVVCVGVRVIPLILKVASGSRWVVCCKFRPLHPKENILRGCVMYRVVRLRPPSIEESIRSQPNRIAFTVDRVAQRRTSSCVLFFHSQYHTTSTPYSFIFHQLYKLLKLKSSAKWHLKENCFPITSPLMFD